MKQARALSNFMPGHFGIAEVTYGSTGPICMHSIGQHSIPGMHTALGDPQSRSHYNYIPAWYVTRLPLQHRGETLRGDVALTASDLLSLSA